MEKTSTKFSRFIDNIICVIFVGIILQFLPILFRIDFLDVVQNSIEDFYITDYVFSSMRDYSKIPIDTNIILINTSHFNRKEIAQQVEIINKYNPKVIAIDAFFKEEKIEDLDTPLVNAFSKVKCLVLGTKLIDTDGDDTFDTIETSHPKFNKFAIAGYVNFSLDDDAFFRTVRRIPIREKMSYDTVYSFPVIISEVYNSIAVQKLKKRNNRFETINYKRNIDKYITIDANELLEKSDSLNFIRGKIVLMGYIGPDLKTLSTEDIFFTPMNKDYYGRTYPDMYGVVVHANVISMILEENYIETNEFYPIWLNAAIVFLIVFLNMSLFNYMRFRWPWLYEPISVFLIFAELFAFFVLVALTFYFLNYLIVLNYLLYGLIFTGMVFELYHDSLKPIVSGKIKFSIKRKK